MRDPFHKAGFDHPCRETCSGWKQGYERGFDDRLVNKDPDDEFDRWIANKPSYYTEELRHAFLAGWRISRGEM